MFKDFKKYLILLSIFFILIVSIGSISASEAVSDSHSLENLESDAALSSDESLSLTGPESSDNVVSESANENNLDNSVSDADVVSSEVNGYSDVVSSEVNGYNDLVSSEDNVYDEGIVSNDGVNELDEIKSLNLKNDPANNLSSHNGEILLNGNGELNEAVKSITIEYSSITKEYKADAFYNVKVYEVTKNGENQVKKPKYYAIVNLRVYTGKTFKNYYGFSKLNGLASINLTNLALGKHKVQIFVNGTLKGTSSINIVKAKTKVNASAITVRLKKSANFNIKVLDANNNALKNLKLKVKVYSGKKYKSYTLKTNSKGMAMLNTKKLSAGTHKVIISANSKYYAVSKKSKIIIKKNIVEKLKVYAPADAVKYKSRSYFNITVLNKNDRPVKNLKVNVKVYTGKKYESHTLKTNSKGIATLNTKKLSLGKHKLIIKSANRYFKLGKTTNVIVKKSVIKFDTPKLVSLNYFENKTNKYYANLTWNSKKGTKYLVIRKLNGKYKGISTVTAKSKRTSFLNKVEKGKLYTYSVRIIKDKKNGKRLYGPYDKEGLKLIDKTPVKVDFQNLRANVTWKKVKDATKYRVYRKMGREGHYKCIAELDGSKLSYCDYYYKSADELSSILHRNHFADPSYNNLFYTVRPYSQKTVSGVKKTSSGLYLKDGDFYLEAPNIVSLKNNTIAWGTVPNAQAYLVLKKDNGTDKWLKIAKVSASKSVLQSLKIGEIDNNAYYSVQAYAKKNGEDAFSKFDTGFSLKNYSAENSKYRILYFGDSITYGSPYGSVSDRHIFSFPYRVEQLLGCVFYNPSIPGSTYHDLGQFENGTNIENTKSYRSRICREVVDQIAEGKLPAKSSYLDTTKNSEGINNTALDDYNIVVLSAGTNDYLDYAELGGLDSDNVSTFNGALNHILGKIEEASQKRVSEGKDAIKVVFVDLFYSDRTNNYKIKTNRDITPNKIGLLLGDYQNALDQQLSKWSKVENLTCYNFKTRDYHISDENNCPYTSADNLHFSKFTYGQYGNAFAQFLLENVFKD